MYSALCSKIIESPYHSGKRKGVVNKFVPHCYVGQVTIERGGAGFQNRPKGKEASCNYLIGVDGRIAGIVDEINRSWCTSSAGCDNYAITVECASDNVKPYAFNKEVFDSLVKLCVDVCKRYNKTKIVYIADKVSAKAYNPKDDEMQIVFHRFYANKACPGDWFVSQIDTFIARVRAGLANEAPMTGASVPVIKSYTVQFGDTLSAIARKYGTTWQILARYNKISSPNLIRPGQVIKIPD